jgi:Zn-dependent protease
MDVLLLASIDFASPLMWATVIGWIMTVVLHEFAHGIVAYWGGDWTIKERGGLTLNPIQYINPVTSIVLPVIFVLMGGVPLVGGATFIRRDLLRNRAWESAVSLAGPAMNLLVAAVLMLLLRPSLGLFETSGPVSGWSNGAVVMGAVATLEVMMAMLNLIPLPPLDGFNAISPFLPEELVDRMRQPVVQMVSLVVLFGVVTRLPVYDRIWIGAVNEMSKWASGGLTVLDFVQAFNLALFGSV